MSDAKHPATMLALAGMLESFVLEVGCQAKHLVELRAVLNSLVFEVGRKAKHLADFVLVQLLLQRALEYTRIAGSGHIV